MSLCALVLTVWQPSSLQCIIEYLPAVTAHRSIACILLCERSLVSGLGHSVCVSYTRSLQDAGTIHVTEVVTAIASAMTSAVVSKISSWWGGKSDAATQTAQRQPQRVENTLSLSMRCVGTPMFVCWLCVFMSSCRCKYDGLWYVPHTFVLVNAF